MNKHDMNMRTLHCIARWPNRKGLAYKTEECLADELDGNEMAYLFALHCEVAWLMCFVTYFKGFRYVKVNDMVSVF